MNEDITELDIDVVTITRDGEGMVSIDGGGLAFESLVFLLRAAEYIAMTEHYYPEDVDDDDED